MDLESAIILIWLLPVLVQIVLPLVMLVGYGIGRLATRVFGYRQSERKLKVTPAIHGEPVAPAAGVLT